MERFKRHQRDRECKARKFLSDIKGSRPNMPFKDRMGLGRKDLVDATLETNMLDDVYSDRWVTVRELLKVIGKSYGTVHGCI